MISGVTDKSLPSLSLLHPHPPLSQVCQLPDSLEFSTENFLSNALWFIEVLSLQHLILLSSASDLEVGKLRPG